jgi:hypothetical protein
MDYALCAIPGIISLLQLGDGLSASHSCVDPFETKNDIKERKQRAIDMAIGCIIITIIIALMISLQMQWVAGLYLLMPAGMLGFYIGSLIISNEDRTNEMLKKRNLLIYPNPLLRDDEIKQ